MIAIRGSPARAGLTRGSAPSLPYAPGPSLFPRAEGCRGIGFQQLTRAAANSRERF
ncbi:hypothetical protein RPHASCH2410_CH13375 [Rhizobium phaseoli Ch24-10]|nr:hypothetical protein RPHASCH2410_CH13375 [Rhizobium phaseoli Ch24-10]